MPTENKNGKRGKVLSFERDNSFFVRRGDAKRAQNDPVSAMYMYNKALESDPNDLDTRLAAAQLLTDMSRFNDSNRLLVPYMHMDEEYRKEAYCIIGFNLIGLNEPEGARICFDRFFDMSDEVSARTDAMLDALDYLDAAEPEQSFLTDVADAEFNSVYTAALRAFDSGNFASSTKLFQTLSDRFPNDPDVSYRVALSLLCEKRSAEARSAAEAALGKASGHVGALSVAMLASNALGNELDSAMLAKKLEAAETDDPDELFRINGALLECDRYDQAEPSARKLVKLLPYSAQANHRLGITLMKQGKFRQAAELYDKLIKIDGRDIIAKYFFSGCMEAASSATASSFPQGHIMVQYQLPFGEIIATVRSIIDNKEMPAERIVEAWETDPDFRDKVRWAFSLGEFNITGAMTALLRIIGDERAQLLLREVIADIEASDSLINEALGALKALGAEEPFFAMAGGRLLEGRVNIVDLDKAAIPANYKAIFPRIMESASGVYSAEVMKTARNITERFLVGSSADFRPISRQQSEALSAAVEFLACEHCGALTADDICERYNVSTRRLQNALDRLISVLLKAGERAANLEAALKGDDSDE